MLFLHGSGGKGKSMQSRLRAAVWQHLHSFVGPNAFVGKEAFRKAGADFHGALFYNVPETTAG